MSEYLDYNGLQRYHELIKNWSNNNHYQKSETYTKSELNSRITDIENDVGVFKDEVRGLVDTPHQEYVTVETFPELPTPGSKDTIYRVSNYNGSTSQIDNTVYSEYAWDGTLHIFLCVKSQISEVFDISEYNNSAKYANLSEALNSVPQSLQKGGMSIKFVQSSDNNYVRYDYMGSSTAVADFTNVANWRGVDDKITYQSNNLATSGAVFSSVNDVVFVGMESLLEDNAFKIENGVMVTYTTTSFFHKVIPVENLISLVTVAGGARGASLVPAIIYLSGEEPIESNRISQQYGTQNTSYGSSIKKFVSPLEIPANATHAIIQSYKAYGDDCGVTFKSSLKEKVENLDTEITEINEEIDELNDRLSESSNLNQTVKMFDMPLSVGLYSISDNELVLGTTGKHIIVPVNNLISVTTVAGKPNTSNKIPAIIYLSSDEPTYANKVGEQYATGTSLSSSIAVFNSSLEIPATATHAIINFVTGYGASNNAEITTKKPVKELVSEHDIELSKIGHRLIVVDINGNGDYTSLQEAINNAGDSAANPKTILVLPGTYVMPTNYSRDNAQGRYLSIIGTDKNNCIVRNDIGYYITGTEGYVDNAPLRLAGNVYVANLTIISTDENYPQDAIADRHKAYCIHLDMNANQNTVCEINNCVLVNNHNTCVGIGLRTNYTVKLVNCEMTTTLHDANKNSHFGTILCHDGVNTSTTVITQHLEVRNCVLTNTNDSYGLYYSNARGGLTDLTLIGNVVDVPDGEPGFAYDETASLTKKCFGNNIASMNYQ